MNSSEGLVMRWRLVRTGWKSSLTGKQKKQNIKAQNQSGAQDMRNQKNFTVSL
jgi:hypothetical protein